MLKFSVVVAKYAIKTSSVESARAQTNEECQFCNSAAIILAAVSIVELTYIQLCQCFFATGWSCCEMLQNNYYWLKTYFVESITLSTLLWVNI
jgi:hypothetical protein